MTNPATTPASGATRRDFLSRSTAGIVGGSLAANLVLPAGVHAQGSDTLRVGLVGCGGRGTGAAAQALNADKNVKLTAMGDAFSDRLESSLNNLKKVAGDKVAVAEDHRFVGFDAYKQVIDSGVDVILLTTPPHFRPMHLKAAVDAGLHVFCEKPVAVDAPGVRSVLATCEEAKKKNLSIVSGLCWRYDNGVRETMKRVLDGAIGDIVAIHENYLTNGLWNHERQPDWSDMEWQLRNWLYFTWLSGDHNVEQHIHSLDKGCWAMHDEPPLKATGLGGRQVRTEEKYGNIFDHHTVIYEYPNGTKMFAFTRQQNGCSNDTNDYFIGTKGTANILKHTISGETNWRYDGPKPSMYQIEHNELFASIRSGQPINNGLYMARSTMVAILGRMATYTGKTITWDQAINSKEDLSPPSYEWGPLPIPPVAMPGVTHFA
jgi:predicted dehydrogenase